MPSRRRVLALGGVALIGLAGCVDEEEAGFLVTNFQRVHQEGLERLDYPEDVLYRVTLENRGPNRERGRLELTLTHDPDEGEPETWSKTDDCVSVSRGTSERRRYVFEDVYSTENDIENYELDARIDQEAELDCDGPLA